MTRHAEVDNVTVSVNIYATYIVIYLSRFCNDCMVLVRKLIGTTLRGVVTKRNKAACWCMSVLF